MRKPAKKEPLSLEVKIESRVKNQASREDQDKPEEKEASEIKEEKEEEKIVEKKKKGIPFDRTLTTKTFILSHLGILIISLVFLAGLYLFLNEGNLPCCASKDFQNYIPVSHQPSSFNLEINNPDDDMAVFDKSIIVSGTTSPNTTVVITNGVNTTGLETNSRGEFSKVLTLNSGLNLITITAYDQSGDSKKELRSVYYSEEKLP